VADVASGGGALAVMARKTNGFSGEESVAGAVALSNFMALCARQREVLGVLLVVENDVALLALIHNSAGG